MITYQLTTALIGLAVAGSILYLVRRDHMHGPYAYWWLAVAAATVTLGLFPQLIDRLAKLTGVSYAPSLLFAIVICLILIRILKSDIERSRHERKIRRLAQHLAILTEENRRLQKQLNDHIEQTESSQRSASR